MYHQNLSTKQVGQRNCKVVQDQNKNSFQVKIMLTDAIKKRGNILEMGLDLDFPPQLMLHTFFLHLRLEQHLQRHNGLQLLYPRKVDIAKLALSKRPANVEVVNGNLPKNDNLSVTKETQDSSAYFVPLAFKDSYLGGETDEVPTHSLPGP